MLSIQGELATAERELEEVRGDLEKSAPWAVWAGMALMSGLLAVSGMMLAFFLL